MMSGKPDCWKDIEEAGMAALYVEDDETLRIVDGYEWLHGAKFIHRRVVQGGLLPAVVESWYPSSNDSYGLMLEDDVELSPLFYAWAKMSLLMYR